MKKEQIQNLAKEFCEAIDIRELYRLTESREKPYELLSTFLQSMIEQGEVYPVPKNNIFKSTFDHHKVMKMNQELWEAYMLGINDRISVEKEPTTVSSAGKEVSDLLGTHEPWPLTDVLLKLIESTEYLLHVNNYDRHGWEEVSHSTKIGSEYLDKLTQSLKSSPASTVMPDKELLRSAFEAGEENANECRCGKCDYCIDIKSEDAPDFEKWYREQLKSRSCQ